MIAIVNYGIGNLGSIQNMLIKVGSTDSVITSEVTVIEQADKIILPGVGAFDKGMEKIHESGLLQTLNKAAKEDKKPILGICLGMQLLTKGSEEGSLPGLGWIDAFTVRFQINDDLAHLKVPHMGWNEVKISKEHPLVNELTVPPRFYFVHSYYVKCMQLQDELLSCHYGIDFTCAVQHENIMGVQFHAEKSHKFGMQLLKNFASL
ncbi:MAG TPA: imidazole glycerol phosphate synthase subunit HisH [Ferruginibacter sp.]|jgi:glutamine amidotransferase|nr:imidazole glycerol phosphate synthase subunit HisH [Ferruginibacter sp.]HQW84552.1 imidazole glycerol phosphate synthase subunit HisH [Ferruginibacter sp.]